MNYRPWVEHAYSPECICFRCQKIGEGMDPTEVDAFLLDRSNNIKSNGNVVQVDFSKVRRMRRRKNV